MTVIPFSKPVPPPIDDPDTQDAHLIVLKVGIVAFCFAWLCCGIVGAGVVAENAYRIISGWLS